MKLLYFTIKMSWNLNIKQLILELIFYFCRFM